MPARTPADVVLRAERLWDGTAEQPAEGVDVRVSDGHIAETGHRLRPRTPDGTVIELPGHTLLPGLIDCHVHVLDDSHDTEAIAYQAVRAVPVLTTLLMNGFTTIRDLGSADQPLNVSLKRAVDEGHLQGPRMLVAPNIISAHGGHGDKQPRIAERYHRIVGTLADGADAVLRTVRAQARAGADWIKFAAGGGFSSPSDCVTDIGYTQHEMDLIVTAATDRGLPVAAHAFGDEAVRRAVRAGVHSIEHACLTGPDTLAAIAERDVFLVPTHYAQRYYLDRLDNDAFWQGRSDLLRDSYAEHADRLRRHFPLVADSGARIAFGSDAGMFPYEENWREFTTLVEHGFTPLQALRAATSHAAELLRQPALGRIRPGAHADLVAVPGNPLADIDLMGRIDFVMQKGKVRRHHQDGAV
ncbi:amidohydrolase family protein [Streptomyces sp. SudanB182_2057]|uniref:metal-dependent hydrolase family protein n=1 Tax=Streptomyces sp. SudanB182_2057 TaxID=3035281 RepID=UPI003F55BE51